MATKHSCNAVALRQVCSLFRNEVEDHVYKRQCFMFKTRKRLDAWCVPRRAHLKMMRKVSMVAKAQSSLPLAAPYFEKLRTLTLGLEPIRVPVRTTIRHLG